jgi:hypothetical protein
MTSSRPLFSMTWTRSGACATFPGFRLDGDRPCTRQAEISGTAAQTPEILFPDSIEPLQAPQRLDVDFQSREASPAMLFCQLAEQRNKACSAVRNPGGERCKRRTASAGIGEDILGPGRGFPTGSGDLFGP